MTALEPSPRQIEAAASQATQLLVIAPPGCGKTELLALRADHLIRSGQIRPGHRILALTFTNKARDNLTDRLRCTLGVARFKQFITVQNFHGFSTRVLRAHGGTLDIPTNLADPRKTWPGSFLKQLSKDWKARRAAEDLIGRVKRQPLTDDEVMAALEGGDDQLAVRAEKQLRSNERYDYPDLLRYAQRILGVEQVARLYQLHFDAVLVDEFQDLSLQQLDVALAACRRNRTFVGDPTQSIFAWAGAEPASVGAKLTEICEPAMELDTSYRSSPAVLAVVNAARAQLGASPLNAANSNAWRDGGATCALAFPSREEEAAWVARIADKVHLAQPDASIGIISRIGRRRMEIDNRIRQLQGVEVRRWDMPVDDPDVVGLLRRCAKGLPEGTPASQLTELEHRAMAMVAEDDVELRDQLTGAIDSLGGTAGSAGSVGAVLREIRDLANDGPVPPGIHLLSAHKGKGQQFDWVFVIGLEEGHVPSRMCESDAQLEEEHRALLVMLSRARHAVFLSRSESHVSRYGYQYMDQASRWWRPIEQACRMSRSELETHIVGLSI